MLGGLARWLRMLGYIADYKSNADDNSLLRSSENPETVLLTRDEELYNRAVGKKIRSVLVIGDTEEARLGQLATTLGISLEIDMATTRCPECGSELHEISKVEAASDVPAKSLELYDRFWRCSNGECEKTYWVGSHWKQMRHTLEEARKIGSPRVTEMKC
jgi:uncharacterized protein with PIN domain